MPIRVTGKVVFVKPEKTDQGRHYKRLQLFSDGNGHPATLENVTDYSNGEWAFGKEVDLEVSLQVYQGKKGLGYSLTYWGGGAPSAGGGEPGSAGKSGKFG